MIAACRTIASGRWVIAIATATVVLLCAALPAAAPPQRPSALSGRLTLTELREWATAVATHEPGTADPPAAQIARWTPGRLYILFTELRSLAAFRRNSRVATRSADNVSYPSPGLQPTEVATVLGLTPEDAGSPAINRFLHHAVMLHTDIGLLVPNTATPASGSPFSGRITIHTDDGRQTGSGGVATHLEFASWLLDGVRPDPAANDTVRGWYAAITAVAQLNRNTGDAGWILERGRRLFPSDARLLFYSGTVDETLAMPVMQAVIRGARTPARFVVGGEPEQEELQRAAGFFAHALEIAPGYAEARLHLGRVSGLLGRHESAVADLTEAAARIRNRTLLYYAWLFLGREQDRLGDRESARQNFARASEAYPRAQSSLLAASELARRTGDSAGALAPLERLLALPADEQSRDDPWWWYDISHVVADADLLLDAWRAMVRSAK